MLSQTMCTSFKADLLGGVHDLDTDVLKLALYTSAAFLDASTTVYTAVGEVSGTGYAAGGRTVSGCVIATGGTTAYLDCDDVTWAGSTITARGALLYNSSKSNKAIVVLDFGGDKASTAGNFTVQMPAASASTAIVRIA